MNEEHDLDDLPGPAFCIAGLIVMLMVFALAGIGMATVFRWLL